MKKFLLFIICIYSSTAIASGAIFSNKLNRCKISKSVLNNYEPEEFQPTNNLLRQTGQEATYSGAKIIIKGKLLDQHCVPISDAKIYLWQTGRDGKYPYKPLRTKVNKNIFKLTNSSTFTGSGIATTNNKGEFYFITLYPGQNPNKAYVNIRVEHRDLGSLQTQLFLSSKFAHAQNCGEIHHALFNVSQELTVYDFDIVMPGSTLRRY
ncbi:dioxygenase [Candidatus Tisiphia endosymbiont of Nemotelus uliginosus]|uniref:dioxygenase family protein n=1 Tax=Candidatus Tisiphia endosymbiont of Nemotelus uliginosus TaxID=3077926 RepID=UPI0035C8F236